MILPPPPLLCGALPNPIGNRGNSNVFRTPPPPPLSTVGRKIVMYSLPNQGGNGYPSPSFSYYWMTLLDLASFAWFLATFTAGVQCWGLQNNSSGDGAENTVLHVVFSACFNFSFILFSLHIFIFLYLCIFLHTLFICWSGIFYFEMRFASWLRTPRCHLTARPCRVASGADLVFWLCISSVKPPWSKTNSVEL